MSAELMIQVTSPSGGVWVVLLDILVLLAMSALFGAVAARLGQNVIVGYLVAGTLVGPNVLGWISTQAELFNIAELGVALLLFAIGLEFSPKRLATLGRIALQVGSMQVIVTTALGTGVAWLCGLSAREALVVGMIVALSSTASVLRLLKDRAEIDNQHGRTALGILLVQDVAVVPMMLLVGTMASGESWTHILAELGLAMTLGIGLIALFYVLFNFITPRLLRWLSLRNSRDLPVLLAVVMATGSAWAAHRVGISPALGAFAAGVLLGISPFAIQIRADSRPLTTVMATLFFAAIGMFGDPIWLSENFAVVGSIVLAIVIGKPLVIALLARTLGHTWRHGVAAGVCLAQVGEFSFVLATIAHREVAGGGLIGSETFRAMVSATLVTLLLTPYLLAAAPWLGDWVERQLRRSKTPQAREAPTTSERRPEDQNHIIIVGYGPAGQRLAEGLMETYQNRMVAIDLNPHNVDVARQHGLRSYHGDARQREVLEHAGVGRAHAVVLTVPNHRATRDMIHMIRDIAPQTFVVARCRYHILHWELLDAGAHEVVDEEDHLGRRLAAQVRKLLGSPT